ncbi:Ig-like domain repeat protein [Methanobrevibacter sp.]|uniref:Ig-like domain repeat protein n=1 Tax=Methanobrevibacter sp. TaxID=66852 RepID=UPI003866E8AF
MLFLILGAVSATELNNASNTEDSNLMSDDVNALSVENKLEVSSEDSISETNIVNSHEDDLNNYSSKAILKSSYEDSYGQAQASDVELNETSGNDVLSISDSDDVLSVGSTKASTKLTISDAHYAKSATYFKVTLKDASGNALKNQKVSLKVKGNTYSAMTNANGIASVKTAALPIGSYSVVLSYAGSASYSASSLSKKVKVLSSVSGSTFTAYYGSVTTYSVKFWKNNVALAKTKVSFTVNGKTYTKTTDSNGVAKLPVNLAPGTYIIKTTNPYSKEKSSNKYISKKSSSTTKLSASSLKMQYKDKANFAVTLKNNNNKVLPNKVVKIIINGKTYPHKTNSKGVAKQAIGLKPGTYKVKYEYSTVGSKDYSHGTSKIVVTKRAAKISAADLVMKHKKTAYYKVTVKDKKTGKVIKGIKVNFKINGKTYTHKTNSKGVAKQAIGLDIGYYSVKTSLSSSVYKPSTASKHIIVNGTKFVGKDVHITPGKSATYSVKVYNYKDKPIKKGKVIFTIDGKKYTVTTSSKGVAKVSLGVLSKGIHTIKYKHGFTTGSSKISVVKQITFKQILSASKTVKKYMEGHKNKLPSSVKIGGVTYSTAEYLYYASKAIVNLKSGSKANIDVKDIAKPSKPSSTYSAGNLYNYHSVAKSLIKTANSKGKMPNSVSSKLGTLGYKSVVYAFSRVVAYYGSHDRLPSFVEIKSATKSTSSSKLNSKNTIEDLTAYLAAAANCQVNNSKIKKLVNKLTSGLTSDKAKATAIFNYVRDTISYSFYYDTKHGAVGTLNAKSGNCVDHSHLLVAMYRTAGLAARYGHGTCTFSSGSTYGHVWTQVLIGDTWTVSDATSSRNSLGKVVNWNANSYKLYGYTSSISF